jgi:hypothetical protein
MCVLNGGFLAPPRPPVYRRDEMALTEKRQPTLQEQETAPVASQPVRLTRR